MPEVMPGDERLLGHRTWRHVSARGLVNMILIVDADVVSGPSLARLLRYNGHAAEVVPSPMEALALLPTHKPAAIIIDLDLPHITGGQMIRAIRSDKTYADVPILVYTGNFSQS